MATQASTTELIAALYRIDGKAEIVDGKIVLMPLAVELEARVAGAIYVSLREYQRRTKAGWAYSSCVA